MFLKFNIHTIKFSTVKHLMYRNLNIFFKSNIQENIVFGLSVCPSVCDKKP